MPAPSNTRATTRILSMPDSTRRILAQGVSCAPTMTRTDLERRLAAATTHDGWIAALGEYFERAGLVFGHGTDNAADEAYWLVRHLEDWRDELYAAPPRRELLPAVAALAERRVAERRPLAYLLGE